MKSSERTLVLRVTGFGGTNAIGHDGMTRFLVLLSLLILVLFLPCCEKKDKAETSGPGLVEKSVRSADGVPIAFSAQGEGSPALVFVHGWSCDRDYWKPQMEHFSKKHRVVAVDLAGHGKSGRGRDVWTMEAFGADVRAVVNDQKLGRMILIGHSMGGPVIVSAARGLSQDVLALVGADTFQDFVNEWPEEERKLRQALQADYAKNADAFVRSMFPESADPALVDRVAADMSAAPPQVAVGAMEGLFDNDIQAALKGLDVPIYCINADFWPTNVEGNRQYAFSFDLSLMPGVGHFVMLEDPARFNRLLEEVIGKVAAP